MLTRFSAAIVLSAFWLLSYLGTPHLVQPLIAVWGVAMGVEQRCAAEVFNLRQSRELKRSSAILPNLAEVWSRPNPGKAVFARFLLATTSQHPSRLAPWTPVFYVGRYEDWWPSTHRDTLEGRQVL